jgi:hypothetical protein
LSNAIRRFLQRARRTCKRLAQSTHSPWTDSANRKKTQRGVGLMIEIVLEIVLEIMLEIMLDRGLMISVLSFH